MSDIFLSYANVDLHRVQPLITMLEEYGWSVWWDRTILPGETYDQVIDEALEATRCVLVVWSSASIASTWVRAEAEEARQRGRLVPVLLDDGLRLPIAFRQIQAANLVGWQGEKAHAEFGKVVRALTGHLGPPPVQNVPPLVSPWQEDLALGYCCTPGGSSNFVYGVPGTWPGTHGEKQPWHGVCAARSR